MLLVKGLEIPRSKDTEDLKYLPVQNMGDIKEFMSTFSPAWFEGAMLVFCLKH